MAQQQHMPAATAASTEDPITRLSKVPLEMLDSDTQKQLHEMCEKLERKMKKMNQKKQTRKSKTKPLPTVKKGRFYFTEQTVNHRRNIVIVYEYNRETKMLKYAQTVYHLDMEKLQNERKLIREENGRRMQMELDPLPENVPAHRYNKQSHYEAAMKRLEDHPVTVENFMDDKDFGAFRQAVRKLTYTHGAYKVHREEKNTHNEAS
jgi:hypothetical protein